MNPGMIDPRTKVMVLLLCVLAATFSPSLPYTFGLAVLILVLGICWRRLRFVLYSGFGLGVLVFLTWLVRSGSLSRTWQGTFAAFIGLLYQVYPCGMMAGLILSSTKVSQFMAAMARSHVPRQVVIPLAIMLRYVPVVAEDWNHIKDAMKMRGITPSAAGFLKQPMRTLECIYVPMIMNASKAADELSVAALTRGIENPEPRTCLEEIRYRWADGVLLAVFFLYFIIIFVIKGGWL